MLETRQEAIAIIQDKVSMDRSRVIVIRGNEKWEDSRYILKIGPTEFSDVKYEIRNRILKESINKITV